MFEPFPVQFLLVALAGWVNRQQLEVIEYLREENRVLKTHLGERRLRLTDAERRRLAAIGQRLGRRVLTPKSQPSSRRIPFCDGTGI